MAAPAAAPFTMEGGAKVYAPSVPPFIIFVMNAKHGATIWVEAAPSITVAKLKKYFNRMIHFHFYFKIKSL